MKLIADSGSTKTDWLLIGEDGNEVAAIQTHGINPIHMSDSDIIASLPNRSSFDLPKTEYSKADGSRHIAAIHFYGSGVTPRQRERMQTILTSYFGVGEANVHAESDLLGAAHALCGHSEGIACILGTGSNSCLYDGQEIVKGTPALGYILGDEGSGAVMGRVLVNAIYKGWLPQQVKEAFEAEMQTSMADVIENVYRKPMANRWLASLTPFISRHKAEWPDLQALVVAELRRFLARNIAPYDRRDLPVNAIGSIAWFFRDELSDAIRHEGMLLGNVERSPMAGLVRYVKE